MQTLNTILKNILQCWMPFAKAKAWCMAREILTGQRGDRITGIGLVVWRYPISRTRCIGFEFCPEVTAKLGRRGVHIKEVPITYVPRSFAQGKKIRIKDGLSAIWTLIRYRFTS